MKKCTGEISDSEFPLNETTALASCERRKCLQILIILICMRKGKACAGSTVSRCPVHVSCTHNITGTTAPKDPADGSGFKAVQVFSKFSVEIPSVVIVDKFWVIAEHNYGGRSHSHLIAVVNLCLCTVAPGWWWLQCDKQTDVRSKAAGRRQSKVVNFIPATVLRPSKPR